MRSANFWWIMFTILVRLNAYLKKEFGKFHRKKPVLESLFNKAASLQACNFIKKRLQCRGFPVKIAKFLRTPILKNICELLLLKKPEFR